MDRIEAERAFHDQQAAERAQSLHDLRFDDDVYLDHETWIRPAMERLGNVRGRNVLDYGCGHGMAAVVLARRGGCVTAFDLSRGYVREALARAEANGVSIDAVTANAERLPFPDGSFDAVWGNAILHHLDLPQAARELRRVMRPGAVAVFCEPWGENPLLNLARSFAPYPHKQRTRDEEPLRRRDLPALREVFPALQVHGYQLLGMVRRVWGNHHLSSALDALDRSLLRSLPGLEMWCRYVVLTWRRE